MFLEFYQDYKNYKRWNYNNPAVKTRAAQESKMLRQTHMIEKGMSLSAPRKGFGQQKIKELFEMMNQYLKLGYPSDGMPFQDAIIVLNAYVQMQKKLGYENADMIEKLKNYDKYRIDGLASVAAGSIIRTEPAAGSQVAAGSTVVVYVSRPQVNTTAKVPALTGLKSVNDARSVLVQNKLGLGSTTEQYSDQPAGTIIGQSPAAGSTVKVNSRVSITVSAGPEPVPETPAEQPGSSSSDWWSGLIGGSSSSSGDSSSSEGTGLGDWWSALLS